jgi:hypothetical protein
MQEQMYRYLEGFTSTIGCPDTQRAEKRRYGKKDHEYVSLLMALVVAKHTVRLKLGHFSLPQRNKALGP